MHPTTRPRPAPGSTSPWFGELLTWTRPARPRFHFPMRSTHYAGRTHELVKLTSAQAQQLNLRTYGWHFTAHPHHPQPTGLGPLLSRDLASALVLAEAWLIASPVDVTASSAEPMPDLLLALAGAGPAFTAQGRVFTVWPQPETAALVLHQGSEHLSEPGRALGAVEAAFTQADGYGTRRYELRWRPRLGAALYLEPSAHWREALNTLVHNVKGRPWMSW